MRSFLNCLCAVAALATAAISCGCTSIRYSGRYGDGTPYDGIGDANTLRRFYIRTFDVPDGYRAKVSTAKIQEIIPELLSRNARPGDVPVDVSVRPGEVEWSGGWTMVFLGILPVMYTADQDVMVDVSVAGMKGPAVTTICHFTYDRKMTVFSPLAAIPYSEKDGCQENQMEKKVVLDVSELFSRTIARSIAFHLRQSALERLTLPEIDFDVGQEGL